MPAPKSKVDSSGKTVAKVWSFPSDSNPDKEYETMQYIDLSTSCNCMGWTRRVDARGDRSCKHTRLVDQGRADKMCASMHDYTKADTRLKLEFDQSVAKAAADPMASGKRRLAI